MQVGDYVSTTGSANPGSNDITLQQITGIAETELGYTYILVDGVTFVEENDTAATVSFRSQYDTLGEGLGMVPDEVDIDQHQDLKAFFLQNQDYEFYLRDTINGRDFINTQIYRPAAAFAIPRKARASVGIHQGPLPSVQIKTLDISNVLNPSQLKVARTTNRNFYNVFVHKWEELPLEEKTIRRRIAISTESQDRIDAGQKVYTVEALGMRESLSALSLATLAQDRLLRKYKFAAEAIKGVKLPMRTGFDLEIGDTVLLDLGSIQATDINNEGSRQGTGNVRLFEVENKSYNLRTGGVTVDLLDSNFSADSRFGLYSPASFIKSASSQSKFVIEPSFLTTRFGVNEWQKWVSLIGASIKVRNSDYSVEGTALLSSLTGNEITLDSDLGFVPAAGYIMELDVYDNQPDSIKLVFAFWSDGSNNFADGGIPYQWY